MSSPESGPTVVAKVDDMTVDFHEHGTMLVAEEYPNRGRLHIAVLSANETLQLMRYAEDSDPPPKETAPPSPAISQERVSLPLVNPEITDKPPTIEPFTIYSPTPGIASVVMGNIRTETTIKFSANGMLAFAENARIFTDELEKNAKKEEEEPLHPWNNKTRSWHVTSPIVLTNQARLAEWKRKPENARTPHFRNYSSR